MPEFKHSLIDAVFVVDEFYYNTEQAYIFSNPQSEIVSYDVFMNVLEQWIIEVGEYDVHLMDTDDLELYRTHFESFQDATAKINGFNLLDIYDKDNKVNRVFKFKIDVKEVSDLLEYSCLDWRINDHKYYDKIERECEETIDEIEKETEAAKDPYSYYGVSRSDF